MDTIYSLSDMGGLGRTIGSATGNPDRTTAGAGAATAGDLVTFSEQGLALARTLTAASNATIASNAAAGATTASNAGTPIIAHSLGLGVSGDGSGDGTSKDMQSLKQMIENIKQQIQTVEKSSMGDKEKENKLSNLRSELAQAQQEYQKAVLDGVGGIPRSGTPAEGMGASLT